MEEQKGVWRTISGRHVFIKEGQSLEDAMTESGKFNNEQKSKSGVTDEDRQAYNEYVQQRLNDKEYMKANTPGLYSIKYGEDFAKDFDNSLKNNDNYLYDNLVNDPKIIAELERNVQARQYDDPDARIGDTSLDSGRIVSNYMDRLSTQEYSKISWDKAEDKLFEKLKEIEKKYGFKD